MLFLDGELNATGAAHMKILIVDDDELLRNALVRVLGEHVQCETANGVQSAITKISTSTAAPFDVLLTDIDMDDGTGFDLAEHLCAQALMPPRVIFMSGNVTVSRLERAMSFNAELYSKGSMRDLLKELSAK